jgi:hypothetical protein
MEVHHHPKVDSDSHRKKKFKEYFLEFVMIFLAVTLGFFAESLREKIVDNDKEIHYVKSIIQDLNKDEAETFTALATQQVSINKMDSALNIKPQRLTDINVQDTFFHYFFHFYTFEYDFIQHDNTYTQLKNAGGFAVIRNQQVIDSITELYIYYDLQLKTINNFYVDYYNKVVVLATQLMDLPIIPISPEDSSLTVIPSHKEFFINVNIPLIRQLYSTIRYDEGTLLYYMAQEKLYKLKVENLIDYLNKQYHLKN